MTLILSGTSGLSDVDGSAATPAIRGTDANTGIFFPAADTIGFAEGGVEAMRIDSSGNVGIGATPSAWSLLKAVQIGNASFAGYSGTGYLMTNAYFDGSVYKYTSSSYANLYTQNNSAGQHAWYTSASGTAGNTISFTQAMTLDSSGNLLVGTTSSVGAGYKMQVQGISSTGSYSSYFAGGSTTSNGIYVYLPGTRSSDTTYFGYILGDDVAIRFRVLGNGNVQNTNNSYGSTSDVKLKENIVDATPKLEKLNQVRIVNYNLKTDPDQKLIGVVAQELEQIFPGLVDESPDQDKDGNNLGTTTKSVKYSVFVPMLIKAIQEQQAIITQLQADVAALKAQ